MSNRTVGADPRVGPSLVFYELLAEQCDDSTAEIAEQVCHREGAKRLWRSRPIAMDVVDGVSASGGQYFCLPKSIG